MALAAVDGVPEEPRLADVTVFTGCQIPARLTGAVTHETRAVPVTLARCGKHRVTSGNTGDDR